MDMNRHAPAAAQVLSKDTNLEPAHGTSTGETPRLEEFVCMSASDIL